MASALVLQCEIPVETIVAAAEIAAENQIYFVLNAAPVRELPERIFAKVDCLIVNEAEASFYIGRQISSLNDVEMHYRSLFDRIKGSLVVTLGEKGSVLCDEDGVHSFPVTRPVKAIDTTGSGDSYVGAFTYMKIRGKTDIEACDFASMVSQRTVTIQGGQSSMPTKDDLTS